MGTHGSTKHGLGCLVEEVVARDFVPQKLLADQVLPSLAVCVFQQFWARVVTQIVADQTHSRPQLYHLHLPMAAGLHLRA